MPDTKVSPKGNPTRTECLKAKRESLQHIRDTIAQYGVESNIPHNDDYWRELDMFRAMVGGNYDA